MKKSLLLIFSLLLAANVCAQTPAQKAAGNYSGELYVNLAAPIDDETQPLAEIDPDTGNQVTDADGNPVLLTFNVVIEAQTDNAVKFGLYNFGFMGLELGDIILNEVPVEEQADGSIKFGDNDPVFFSFLDGGIQATAKINETNSYVKGNYAYIDVDVVWTNVDPEADPADDSDDMAIYVRFTGTDAVKTGIAGVHVQPAVKAIYDLQGRRAEKGNGIRIVAGKKIVR